MGDIHNRCISPFVSCIILLTRLILLEGGDRLGQGG